MVWNKRPNRKYYEQMATETAIVLARISTLKLGVVHLQENLIMITLQLNVGKRARTAQSKGPVPMSKSRGQTETIVNIKINCN